MTLNELITIYTKTQVQDAFGTLTTTRTKIADAYAKVRPMSGAERNRTDQREEYADYRFWIHQRTDVNEADLIVWDGVDYDIRFIAHNSAKEPYLMIDAQRGGAM